MSYHVTEEKNAVVPSALVEKGPKESHDTWS